MVLKCAYCEKTFTEFDETALWGHIQLNHEKIFKNVEELETPRMLEVCYENLQVGDANEHTHILNKLATMDDAEFKKLYSVVLREQKFRSGSFDATAFIGKPKSAIVKKIMYNNRWSVEDAAKILNTTVLYFNNKLYRNSFSFDDILRFTESSVIKMSLDEMLEIYHEYEEEK